MAVDERGFPGEPNDNLTATTQRPEQLADFVETARLLILTLFQDRDSAPSHQEV